MLFVLRTVAKSCHFRFARYNAVTRPKPLEQPVMTIVLHWDEVDMAEFFLS